MSKTGPQILYSLSILSILFFPFNKQDAISKTERIVEINPSSPTRLMTGTRCGPPAGATLSGGISLNNEDPRAAEWTKGWDNLNDKIMWKVKATSVGDYEVALVYRCNKGLVGSTFEFSCGENKINGVVRESGSPSQL